METEDGIAREHGRERRQEGSVSVRERVPIEACDDADGGEIRRKRDKPRRRREEDGGDQKGHSQ